MDKKQKQIEEMARIIAFDLCPNRSVHAKWGEEAQCYSDNNFAECTKIKNVVDKLYNAGYRKIPENSVVLTREEYEKVKHVLKYEPEEAIIRLEDLAKNERLYNPHMFCSLAGCSGVHKGCNRTCKESWIVIERKETAKECYEKMLEDCPIICDEEHTYSEFVKHYKNWLKERFGVEME